MPAVSVIVPNYNHAPFLKQRIDSVLYQTYQDFELILLDDCSSDNSREIIESYRGNPLVSQIVYNDSNSGSAFRQWKKGIELAQGEWVWIAESDDWAEPTFLEEMLSAAAKYPSCSIVATTPLYVYPDGNTWHQPVSSTPQYIPGPSFARNNLLNGNCLTNASALLLRRKALTPAALDAIVDMRLCGDWMLYVHCCQTGDVLLTGKVLSSFRQHGDNTSSSTERQGLPLIEGAKVLDYIYSTFNIPANMYARCWGRTWAKLEKKHKYNKQTRNTINKSMKNHPAIKIWHTIYRLKLSL